MNRTRRAVIAGLSVNAALPARPALAQLGTVLSAPVTLFDRALEDRSAADIAKDNEIVVKAHLRSISGVRRVVDYIEARPKTK